MYFGSSNFYPLGGIELDAEAIEETVRDAVKEAVKQVVKNVVSEAAGK